MALSGCGNSACVCVIPFEGVGVFHKLPGIFSIAILHRVQSGIWIIRAIDWGLIPRRVVYV